MDSTRPIGIKTFTAAALLAAAVIGIGAVSLVRKVESFQPLGLEATLEAGHWEVLAVGSRASRVEAGDRILLVNGREFGQVPDLATALRARATSELVVLRGERLETVSHTLPPLAVDLPYLILALIGVGYLLIGCYTLFRDRRRAALLFLLWCLASTALYLASPAPPFDALGKAIYLVDALARILLPPLTMHLFMVFPQPLFSRPRPALVVPFLYLPAAFLLVAQADLMLANGALMLGGAKATTLAALDRIELIHFGIYCLAAVIALTWRLRDRREREAFRQSAWLAVGVAAGYLPFVALYVAPTSFDLTPPPLLTAAAVIPLALVPLTFAYAILRYKLWDIGVLVRDSIAMGMTVLIGVLGFSLANLVINRLVADDLVLARNLLSFASGLTIAGLLVPTRRTIGNSLERLQYGGGFARRRALTDLGRELLEERDLTRLATSLLDGIEAALAIEPLQLLLAEGDRLRPVGSRKPLEFALDQSTFDEGFWRRELLSLSGVELAGDEPSSRQRLFALGYRYAFPLTARDEPIGVLLAGYRGDAIRLNSDDIDLVRSLLNQAALAIENAHLIGRVNDQLDEVVRLQQFSVGIIQSSPAGIAVIDAEGIIVLANAAFGKLTETDHESLSGRPLQELLPVGPLPSPDEGIREIGFDDPGGRERCLQLSVAPIGGEDEQILEVVVVHDVTDRVAMENELKEKDRLASLGMLAAGVAHEVNTPITGISSYAQMLLADTPEDDPRHALLRKVERQTFRAASIVNNLLEFARNRQREHTEVPVGAMLDECLELLRERIEERRITLEWGGTDDAVRVFGNDDELAQVFTNLVLNAVDAMGEDGKLTVTVEADERWVRAAVEDDGPGIPHDELKRIFQPFYSTKLAAGGTGLGLSISYNIVRHHGGDIRVVSRPGQGSRFIVELPRHRADSDG